MAELREAHLRYLLAIYELGRTQPDVGTLDIANALGYTKASVTKMAGTLMDMGLLVREKYGKIYLTGAKDNGSLFDIEELFSKPVLTYLCLKQIIQAQFRLVLPLHLAGTGVVDHKKAAICQQNPGSSGTANE